MSVLDPCIFQSIIKSITHLKYLRNFTIEYDGDSYLRRLKLGGTITNQFELDKND